MKNLSLTVFLILTVSFSVRAQVEFGRIATNWQTSVPATFEINEYSADFVGQLRLNSYSSSLKKPTGFLMNNFGDRLGFTFTTTKDRKIYTDDKSNTDLLTITRDGNIGIGVNEPNGKLVLKDVEAIRKIVLYDGFLGVISPDNPNFYGFGVKSAELRYQSVFDHVFYTCKFDIGSRPQFFTSKEVFRIKSDGNVFAQGNLFIGGSFSVSSKLKSNYSTFIARGVLSEDYAIAPRNEWADYVFTKDYTLKPLHELALYIKQNGSLPNIPTTDQVAKEGYNLHEMNVKFLEKIEELTLYTIQQNEKLIQQTEKLKVQGAIIEELKNRLDLLEKNNGK